MSNDPVFEEQVVEFRLSQDRVMHVRIRVGSNDIQVPKPPPRPTFCGVLDLGNDQCAEITVDFAPPG